MDALIVLAYAVVHLGRDRPRRRIHTKRVQETDEITISICDLRWVPCAPLDVAEEARRAGAESRRGDHPNQWGPILTNVWAIGAMLLKLLKHSSKSGLAPPHP